MQRVARPVGLLAVWCYQLHTITPEIDAVVTRLYSDIVGADWPPERRLVEDGYKSLSFPFEELAPPPFQMTHSWDFSHILGYLGSWSSTQRYQKRTGRDPVELIKAELAQAWGDLDQERQVTWPLHLRVGRIFAGASHKWGPKTTIASARRRRFSPVP